MGFQFYSRYDMRRKLDDMRQAGLSPQFSIPQFVPTCDKVSKWWDSSAKIKLLCGGNQSGKSTTGGAYVAHVVRSQPDGLSWACAKNFNMVHILLDKLKEYLAPEELPESSIVWAARNKGIPFSYTHPFSRHVLKFKSMDSSLYNFESEQIRGPGIIWIDEECERKQVFSSCVARTTKYGSPIIMTMTPHKGKTWVYHDIFQLAANRNAVPEEKQKENIYADTITLYDNTALPREMIDEVVDKYADDEIQYRVYGKWAQLTGRVYPKFNVNDCVVSYSQELLDTCHTILRSIDFGRWKAVTWLGIDHNEKVYILHEWKESEYTIAEMAEAIAVIEHDMARRADDTITDHAFQERYELEQYGIYCTPADKSIRKGIEIINRRIKHNAFFVCESCPKTIAELEEYIYNADSPDPKKGQDDHLSDTVRYNVMEAEKYCSGRFGEIPRIETVSRSMV